MGRSWAEAVKALVRRMLFAVGLETMWWCLTASLPLPALPCVVLSAVLAETGLAGAPLWLGACLVSLLCEEVVFSARFGALEVWPAALAASVMASTSPVLQPAW